MSDVFPTFFVQINRACRRGKFGEAAEFTFRLVYSCLPITFVGFKVQCKIFDYLPTTYRQLFVFGLMCCFFFVTFLALSFKPNTSTHTNSTMTIFKQFFRAQNMYKIFFLFPQKKKNTRHQRKLKPSPSSH